MERFYRLGSGGVAALLVPFLAGFAGAKKVETLPVFTDTDFQNVIKAMTFNVRVDTFIDGPNRWDKRKAYVADLIADQAPDVVGLQEAKSSQYTDLRGALPHYAGYAAGRDNGKEKGETCAVLYRKDLYAKLDSGTFWFSDTPEKAGSKDWGNMPPRICSWVRLINKNTHASFYVYNVHMDHLSQNSRKKSVRLLTQRISARKTNDPYIVMGDFNMKINNSAMEYLQTNTEAPMADAWTAIYGDAKSRGTRHGFNGSSGPTIDHIPLSKDLRAVEVTIDNRKYNGRWPSDHSPVIAKILMPSKTFAEANIETAEASIN